MLVSRAGARRGFPGLIFGGSLHNHTRWTASAKPVSTGRHNTNSTLHSPRHCFSAWCDSELAVSLLSFWIDCCPHMHTCEGCLICASLLAASQTQTEPDANGSPSFELTHRVIVFLPAQLRMILLRMIIASIHQSCRSCYRDRHNGWHHEKRGLFRRSAAPRVLITRPHPSLRGSIRIQSV